jgi:hypothetical protein
LAGWLHKMEDMMMVIFAIPHIDFGALNASSAVI